MQIEDKLIIVVGIVALISLSVIISFTFLGINPAIRVCGINETCVDYDCNEKCEFLEKEWNGKTFCYKDTSFEHGCKCWCV